MGRTERRYVVAASIVFLLGLMAEPGAALSAGPDETAQASSEPSASPAAFAERAAAGSVTRGMDSLRSALELIVLAAACAIAVALYSAADGQRRQDGISARMHRR
jgi:hypothetical protein